MPIPTPLQPRVADADIVREHLPLPVVHYPGLHGVFIGFASDRRADPFLCRCAQPAAEHLFTLYPVLNMGAARPGVLLNFFPTAIAHRLLAWNGDGLPSLDYLPGLCHRCNSALPLLRYCDPAEGSDFMQRFGWYVNQAYLHFGMLPYGRVRPSDHCPTECRSDWERAQNAEEALLSECARLLELTYGHAGNCRHDQPYVGRPDDIGQLLSFRAQASAARHQLKARIEALVRQQVGSWVTLAEG